MSRLALALSRAVLVGLGAWILTQPGARSAAQAGQPVTITMAQQVTAQNASAAAHAKPDEPCPVPMTLWAKIFIGVVIVVLIMVSIWRSS